jgi:hypothetical protein
MGLLDDAIREHLELKRQHGGDPSEIERQEHEAFGPGGRRTAPVEDAAAPADEADEPPDEDATVVQPPPDDDTPAAVVAPTEEEAIDPPPDAGREETAPGHDEDPWLVEETADPDLDAESQEEDVLEDTPDFLQETPEHDRLWFEQKPPRDFDWDK